jgi:redox-sensing transcriptional repressor
MRQRGTTTVSSEELAADGGTTGAQVRKDLSQFGSFGKRGTGYDIGRLSEHLREILGLDRRWRVLLVGAGRIGAALFEYPNFARRGYDCVAIIDDDPVKIGQRWGQVPIQSADRLECVIKEERIDLVILAVPGEAAQAMADRAVAAGARGLMNFAPTQLKITGKVPVSEVNLVMELEALSFAITRVRQPA